jgi:septum formation protein
MALWLGAQPAVLASRSRVRRTLLEAAGIAVEILPADIDERKIADDATLAATAAADLLAREKALAIARQMPGRTVIGADQTLAFGERQLHKSADRAAAAQQLRMLRGKSHALHSAVAVVRDGTVQFAHVATAVLTMRDFSEDLLARYLDAAGDDVLASVGGYQLEGMGSHLFARVEGDYFTVLGLPLLPLLDFLRREKLVAA